MAKYDWGATCFLKSGAASNGEYDYSPKGFTAGLMQSAETASFGGVDSMALTIDEAKKQGYWPVTKAIVDSVYQNLNGGRLLLSGYSQGGARAQLARMYVQKKYGVAPPVVTFAAVGAQCFPRELYDGGSGRTNFLDDVDPTKAYENVTDYAHALDPYGSNLGPDIGTTCYVGNSDIATSAARKYCGRVYGYSGPRIYYDSNFPGANALDNSGSVKDDFRICKYFTHSLMAVQAELYNTNKLFGNGTTDGLCRINAPIPSDGSAADVCPDVTWSLEEKAAIAGILVLILLCVGFFLTCVFKVCCKFMPCCPCGKAKPVADESLTKANAKHVV